MTETDLAISDLASPFAWGGGLGTTTMLSITIGGTPDIFGQIRAQSQAATELAAQVVGVVIDTGDDPNVEPLPAGLPVLLVGVPGSAALRHRRRTA